MSGSVDGAVRVFLSGQASDSFSPVAEFSAPANLKTVLAALRCAHGGALAPKDSHAGALLLTGAVPAGDYILVLHGNPIAIKVVLNKIKLVVPTPSPLHKVHHFMRDVAARFDPLVPRPSQNVQTIEDDLADDSSMPINALRIAELRTTDGFLINSFDQIGSVLHDGMTVEAVEWGQWAQEQEALCSTTWPRVLQPDFVDDQDKLVQVGLHANNKLFISIRVQHKTVLLELYDIETLHAYSKPGKQLVLHKEGQREGGKFAWHAQACFVIDERGKVTDVEVSVRSMSSARPEVMRVAIDVRRGVLVKGAVTVVQSADEDESTNGQYELPTEEHIGPVLVDAKQTTSGTELHKLVPGEGWCGLRGEEVEPVLADQTWSDNGAFKNNFFVHLQLVNPTDRIASIVKLRGEYLNADGQWVPVSAVASGSKRGFYNYSWNWDHPEFTVDPHMLLNLALVLGISVKEPHFERQHRAHRTLPSPLHMRAILEDDQGKTASLAVTFVNPPYELPTRASREQRAGKPLDYFVSCDDVIAEQRIFAHVGVEEQNLVLQNSQMSSNLFYIYKKDLKRLQFEAHKEGKSEIPLPKFSVEADGRGVNVFGLVDLARPNGPLYAFKFVLRSLSSSTVGYYLLPKLTDQ